ncbi:MAG: HTTM domain-containing protein [Deltaproteobacteria bacterium]|nr:HTTM domain-containing protein [Nannocystaceae bacterium]
MNDLLQRCSPTRWVARACTPVDIASLAALRIGVGALLLISVVRFWAMGWIDELYVMPRSWLPYWGFGWIEPLPSPAMHAVFVAMAACALLVTLGLSYRLAAIGLLLSFVFVELLDATNYLNHYYLVSLLLLGAVLAPLGRAWSLDAWLGRVQRRQHVPAWMVAAVRLQLGLVYLFAGVAKLGTDWLVHAQPLRLWLPVHADMPVVGPWLAAPALAHVLSIGGAVFDLAVFPALLWARTRPWAYAAVIGFHTVTGLLFPIGMFPWIMIVATTVFFAPDWPRRWITRLRAEEVVSPAHPSIPRGRAAVLGALALGAWFGVQLALPLRSLAYPGNVSWHEQGHRFAWRVMVVEKTGWIEYRVVDGATGRTWWVDPSLELTRRQSAMLAVQPDLILRHAHRIAQRFRDGGVDDVQVYADAFVAFDGRPSTRMIDPAVDLAAVQDGLDAYAWVLPTPSTDPS